MSSQQLHTQQIPGKTLQNLTDNYTLSNRDDLEGLLEFSGKTELPTKISREEQKAPAQPSRVEQWNY